MELNEEKQPEYVTVAVFEKTIKELQGLIDKFKQELENYKHTCTQEETIKILATTQQQILGLYSKLDEKIDTNHEDVKLQLQKGSQVMENLGLAIEKSDWNKEQTKKDMERLETELKGKASKEQLDGTEKTFLEKVDSIYTDVKEIKQGQTNSTSRTISIILAAFGLISIFVSITLSSVMQFFMQH